MLVLRAQLGSPDAWTRLVARYDARLLFYLRRLLGTPAEAEDARQDVWLAVIRKLHALEHPAAFRAWLYRIARHRAISLLRRRRGEIPLEAADEVDIAAVPGEEPPFAPDEAAAAFAALGRLSAAHREALTLRYLSELSYHEIAEVTGTRVGTVRSRIHYATAALRRAMDDQRRLQPGDER